MAQSQYLPFITLTHTHALLYNIHIQVGMEVVERVAVVVVQVVLNYHVNIMLAPQSTLGNATP
jgi:hypothetical protein